MTVEHAIAFAANKHQGQKDKAGVHYIFHPIRVMIRVYPMGDDYACAAILHDVVEDCGVTLDDLRSEGFSEVVVDAVDHLSKRKGEDYMDFVRRCKRNPVARAIKYMDIMDNMSRMDPFPQLKVEELRNKYNHAMLELSL